MSNLSDWVVVFDLDDTLYSEDDYNQSGVIAVSNDLARLFNLDITEQLLSVREEKGDIWGRACELLSIPATVKESLIWMYRLHQPQIDLGQEIVEVVADVSKQAQQVVILTDGRSITQRLKLDALSLLEYTSYISEEYNFTKPMAEGFQIIMSDFPATNYAYIADNPVKDFVGPNSLGWKTIGVRDGGRNIHPQIVDNVATEYLPNVWVQKHSDIVKNLC